MHQFNADLKNRVAVYIKEQHYCTMKDNVNFIQIPSVYIQK